MNCSASLSTACLCCALILQDAPSSVEADQPPWHTPCHLSSYSCAARRRSHIGEGTRAWTGACRDSPRAAQARPAVMARPARPHGGGWPRGIYIPAARRRAGPGSLRRAFRADSTRDHPVGAHGWTGPLHPCPRVQQAAPGPPRRRSAGRSRGTPGGPASPWPHRAGRPGAAAVDRETRPSSRPLATRPGARPFEELGRMLGGCLREPHGISLSAASTFRVVQPRPRAKRGYLLVRVQQLWQDRETHRQLM